MANNTGKFERDLNILLSRLSVGMEKDAANELSKLKNDLVDLHRANIIKINHSVMELVCAKYLIQKGYEVEVEHVLNEMLTCDLYSTKGYGNLIVEIETGYIPPEHALDPLTYTFGRLASKIIRYSSFAGKFALGVPPHYILPLPRVLAIPPRRRTVSDMEQIKNLCDWYYQKPPVTLEDIRNARIHEIYIIDVDRTQVLEMDPQTYMKRALHKGVLFTLRPEPSVEHAKAAEPKIRDEEKIDYYAK